MKKKQKCIGTVTKRSLTIILHWILCRNISSKFSRQQNFVVQTKLSWSKISARAIACHFMDWTISSLYKFNFNFL